MGFLSMLTSVLPVLLLELGFLLFGRKVLKSMPMLRRRMIKNPLWQAQFLLHPVIMAACIYLCGTQLARVPITADYTIFIGSLLVVPFACNFGVEPWDLQSMGLWSFVDLYLHHTAPVLLCLALESSPSPALSHTALVSTACLVAHAWLLHPMHTVCDIWKFCGRDALFWPYILQGLALKYWWCYEMSSSGLTKQRGMEWLRTAVVCSVLLQFLARWSLTTRFLGVQIWKGAKDDPFEPRKNFWELACFAVAYLATNVGVA